MVMGQERPNNSGSTSKECFNVANGCEFCVKEEEEEEEKKERKRGKFFQKKLIALSFL